MPYRCIFLTSIGLTLLTAFGAPAWASLAERDQAIAFADSLLGHGHYREAADQLEALVLQHPADVEVRWRLGKAFVDLGEAEPGEKEQKGLYERAVRELREAVRLGPDHRDAVFNLAIAVGRDGLVRGARDKVRASREVKELAERTIEIDPEFDGAYHLLGRWHREVKSLGFFTKSIVKIVYGGFPDASYEQALSMFEKAYALQPRMAHLLEIGICHDALGDRERAREVYRQVLAMQSDHADAWMMRAEAQRRL
jgi:tetratricopeptide (TPR) repeat protein